MEPSKKKYTGVYVLLGMLFLTCLIVSNLIAGKMWAITDNIIVPASVIFFPVTYILADVFTEVYGFSGARLIIWAGFACNFFAVITYVITILLPYPMSWQDQFAFVIVFGMTPRVLAASLAGYLFGEFSNSIIMSKLKIKMKGKRLWIRTIGSTIVGEALDSLIFISIAFGGLMPFGDLMQMVLFQYLFKVAFEAVFTPVTYKVVGFLKEKEGIDTYDYDQKYRLF